MLNYCHLLRLLMITFFIDDVDTLEISLFAPIESTKYYN